MVEFFNGTHRIRVVAHKAADHGFVVLAADASASGEPLSPFEKVKWWQKGYKDRLELYAEIIRYIGNLE